MEFTYTMYMYKQDIFIGSYPWEPFYVNTILSELVNSRVS